MFIAAATDDNLGLAPQSIVLYQKWATAGKSVELHMYAKGGHGFGRLCRDCLALPNGSTAWFEAARIATINTHGTGCVLSDAIASWLGRGASLPDAVRLAQSFLQRALLRGRALEWGDGHGPAFYGAR